MSHNHEECADTHTPRHCVETRPPTAFIIEESTSVQKRRRLTFPLSGIGKNYVSELDVEDAIRSINPTIKIGVKITSSMVVEQLGILVDIDRKKSLNKKLNNYLSKRKRLKKHITANENVTVLTETDGVRNIQNVQQKEDENEMEQSFSTSSIENVSVTCAIIGPTRIPWDRLSPSGKTKRKQKIGRKIADAIKEISEISEGVLKTGDVVKEVIAQLLPDLELVPKKSRDLKPEATLVHTQNQD
ncbi:uncharacterized protein LOC134813362 [Bolinopsis microptera]|uniref:uncharacterized protein LOC134813362 n=1 Tax=Bolinopsis microptera TaxID=2820187 RepID=UPI00307AD843